MQKSIALKCDLPVSLKSFDKSGVAVVFGATGGIGSALVNRLIELNHFKKVIGFSRNSAIRMDLSDESSIKSAAEYTSTQGKPHLIFDATGYLHDSAQMPEKSWRDINFNGLSKSLVVNAIGPALLMKHFLPQLPRQGKSVFATLSARVGSIGDNYLGGWYGYRASKAALNQLVKTASIELSRRAPNAICIALHPGTVKTSLSAPFSKHGTEVHSTGVSALNLVRVVENLDYKKTGGFFDWRGIPIEW